MKLLKNLAPGRRERKPPRELNWFELKLTVFLLWGVLFYTYYVYVGRLCYRMIVDQGAAQGSKGAGIALLVVFNILYILLLWAYIVVLLTPPGRASDHVPKTDEPQIGMPDNDFVQIDLQAAKAANERSRQKRLGLADTIVDLGSSPLSNGDTVHKEDRNEYSEKHSKQETSLTFTTDESKETRVDIDPPPGESRASSRASYIHFEEPPEDYVNQAVHVAPMKSEATHSPTRNPPQAPVLSDMYRYDTLDCIVRPYRSHRCRRCGYTVLRMDHHCPWVGGCVGELNYSYFYVFLLWAVIFSTFVFVSLMVCNTQGQFDGQQIAIIVTSFFFTSFTIPLYLSHTRQLIRNITTIELTAMNSMSRVETLALIAKYGHFKFGTKKKIRAQWDKDWGHLSTEGNIWWLGSAKANWIDTLGTYKPAWFLPLKPRYEDREYGEIRLTYPVNPRFTSDGTWRRRSEWPKELQ